MKWVILVVLASLALIFYAAYGRPWLKRQPWAAGFFRMIEPLELALFKNSETILIARFKMLVGVVLTFMTMLGSIDLTPILGMLPDQHQELAQFFIKLMPMALTLLGMLDERLRNGTTKPLEVVAIPETKPIPAPVADALAQLEAVKAAAVAEVQATKAQGAI